MAKKQDKAAINGIKNGYFHFCMGMRAQKAAYVRQGGFDPIQQEQMVLQYIEKHGSIKRVEVMDLCRISGPQAYHLLK